MKVGTMKTVTEIAQVKSERCKSLLLVNLFNLCGVDASYRIDSHRDTDYTYAIFTEQRYNKAHIAAARQFAAGFVAAFNAL